MIKTKDTHTLPTVGDGGLSINGSNYEETYTSGIEDEVVRLRHRITEMTNHIRDTHVFLQRISPSLLPEGYRKRRLELIRKGTDNGF